MIIAAVLVAVALFLAVLNINFIRLKNDKYSSVRQFKAVSRITSWGVPLVTNTKIKIDGLALLDQVEMGVIYANHQSYFDIFSLLKGLKRPHGYIAKKEMEKFPIVNNGMRLIQCGFLDRDDNRSAAKVILEAIKTVKTGHLMVIFPEGTRQVNAPMGHFKAGSFKVATKAKASIIPMTIYNTFEVGKRWPRPTTIKIKIHTPISYDQYKEMATHEIAEMVEKIVKQDLNEQHVNK